MNTEEILEDVYLDLIEVLEKSEIDSSLKEKIEEAALLIAEVLEKVSKEEKV